MMAMHDQLRTARGGEVVDHGKAVPVTGRRLVRDQNIESLFGETIDVVGENRVAMP